MARLRTTAAAAAQEPPRPPVPEWVLRFDSARWASPGDGELLNDEATENFSGLLVTRRRRERWQQAGRRWLAEHGYDEAGWYAIVTAEQQTALR